MKQILQLLYLLITISVISLPVIGQDSNSIREVAYLPQSDLLTQVEWSPDGSKLASMSWSEIQIWDTNNWELLLSIPDTFVYAISWHPSGDIIGGIRGGLNENLVLWDVTTGEIIHSFSRERLDETQGILVVHDLTWTPDGDYIISDSGLSKDVLLMWDITSDVTPISLVSGDLHDDYYNIIELEISVFGQMLLSGGSEGEESIIRVWDVNSREPIFVQQGFAPVEWGSDSTQVASVASDYLINIWDIDTEQIIMSFDTHTNTILALSWNIDTDLMASADLDNNLEIWYTSTGISLYNNSQLTNVYSLDWEPDGNQLAITSDGGITILEYVTE